MTTITFNRECLKAVAPFVSTEETRYYLNGVYIADGLLVATDGHRLAVIRPKELDGAAREGFILSKETVKKILGVKPDKKEVLYVRLDPENKLAEVVSLFGAGSIEEASTVKGQFILASFPFTPVDGDFPPWKRLFPPTAEYEPTPAGGVGKPQTFNAKYLAAFQSFGMWVRLFLNANTNAPCVVRGETDDFDAVGLLMSCRGDSGEGEIYPAWLGLDPSRSPPVRAKEPTEGGIRTTEEEG
jgi:hypothetical protein